MPRRRTLTEVEIGVVTGVAVVALVAGFVRLCFDERLRLLLRGVVRHAAVSVDPYLLAILPVVAVMVAGSAAYQIRSAAPVAWGLVQIVFGLTLGSAAFLGFMRWVADRTPAPALGVTGLVVGLMLCGGAVLVMRGWQSVERGRAQSAPVEAEPAPGPELRVATLARSAAQLATQLAMLAAAEAEQAHAAAVSVSAEAVRAADQAKEDAAALAFAAARWSEARAAQAAGQAAVRKASLS